MRKVAIACQGGGSQTAFTAGVLRALLANDVDRGFEIVSLSGTSGGALCAALAWYGLLTQARGDPTPIPARLLAFWEELSAASPLERIVDESLALFLRLTHQGQLPRFELGPACPATRAGMTFVQSILPRAEFTDLKALLEKHIRFDQLVDLVGPESPVLLVGAANVQTGELKKFNSRKGEICAQALLASAAVPALFPAVRVGEHYYWDGLFSDNPPVHELIEPASVGARRLPDEIWVIQINPTHYNGVPSSPDEIIDRRNQMVGNLSLMQNLDVVKLINLLLQAGALNPEVLARAEIIKHDPFEVRFIRMSEKLQESLDYVSKLTRGPAHIGALIADGERQGRAFIEQYVIPTMGDDDGHPREDAPAVGATASP